MMLHDLLQGVSQGELAALLNTTQPAVSQWVSGKRKPGPVSTRLINLFWLNRYYPQKAKGWLLWGRVN